MRLLREAMDRACAEKGQRKFLVDGFPRNPENLSVWTEVRACLRGVQTCVTCLLADPSTHPPTHPPPAEQKMAGLAQVKATLYLNAPEQVMLDRLLERGKTSGRDDDNAESIKKRCVGGWAGWSGYAF